MPRKSEAYLVRNKMAFIFPKREREIFQKTFLKDINIFFGFKPIEQKDCDAPKLVKFFDTAFALNFDWEQLKSGVEIRSQDEQLRFSFGLEHAELKMKFPAYRRFEFALQWVQKMQEYLSALGVPEITEVIIGKYNELQYKSPTNKMSLGFAMKSVFSSELLNYGFRDDDSFNNESLRFDGLARWEKRIVINDEKMLDTHFNIEYGFKKKETRDSIDSEGVLTLKTSINKKASSISIDDIPSYMNDLNEIIDEGFFWCVNETVINEMREKK